MKIFCIPYPTTLRLIQIRQNIEPLADSEPVAI